MKEEKNHGVESTRFLKTETVMDTNGRKEKPILFSGPMVRAILQGSKSQTRRVINPQPTHFHKFGGHALVPCKSKPEGTPPPTCGDEIECRYGYVGGRLWVRETWAHLADLRTRDPGTAALASRCFYRADYPTGLNHDDNPAEDLKWRPSIFMPRNLSRLSLEITDVRVERLQEITGRDAFKEGCNARMADGQLAHAGDHPSYSISEFHQGWNKLNAKRGYSWESNPWVWVISFKPEQEAAL